MILHYSPAATATTWFINILQLLLNLVYHNYRVSQKKRYLFLVFLVKIARQNLAQMTVPVDRKSNLWLIKTKIKPYWLVEKKSDWFLQYLTQLR